MYGKPRTATVTCVVDGWLWCLERKAFRGILVDRMTHDNTVKVLRKVQYPTRYLYLRGFAAGPTLRCAFLVVVARVQCAISYVDNAGVIERLAANRPRNLGSTEGSQYSQNCMPTRRYYVRCIAVGLTHGITFTAFALLWNVESTIGIAPSKAAFTKAHRLVPLQVDFPLEQIYQL